MSWQQDLARAQFDLKKNITDLRNKLFIEMTKNIIEKSPVDTGRFKANWQATVNIPAEGVAYEAVPRGQKISYIPNPSIGLRGAKLSDTLYLANNLQYAWPLELGWSPQAPAGFVRAELASAEALLDEAIQSIKGN